MAVRGLAGSFFYLAVAIFCFFFLSEEDEVKRGNVGLWVRDGRNA